MRALVITLSILIGCISITAYASIAGVWQFPLDVEWSIDPEFQFGSSYGGRTHLGEDVVAPAGTPVYAAANGVVRFTGNFPGYHDWGGLVLIENRNVTGSTVVSLYGHFDAKTISVRPGQIVNRGQRLGLLGDKATNGQWKPHIHFAIRNGGYVSSPWIYYGFGSSGELSRWQPAHEYVPAHENLKEVARVPVDGRNRYATAVGASQFSYPASQSVTDVVLVSGERYQDALSATVLARELDAPMLLTQQNGMPDDTYDEILRVLQPSGAVWIVGGSSVVGQPIAEQLAGLGYTIQRIAGEDSTATSIAVADTLANIVPDFDSAFVVSSQSFADGLSAGVPATMQRAPVLLTDPDQLSQDVSEWLAAVAPKNIYLVGGTAALSAVVHQQVGEASPESSIERMYGNDRYETNRAILEQFVGEPETLVAATGEGFADALVGSVLAAQQQGGLLLTGRTALKAQVEDYVATVGPNMTLALVMGGQTAVAQSVDEHLGLLLNPGFVGASLPTNIGSSVVVDWGQLPRASFQGISLPVPSESLVDQESVGGLNTAVIYASPKEHAELALIAQLPGANDARSEISTWLGIDSSFVEPTAENNTYLVRQGFAERVVRIVQVGNKKIVIAVSSDQREFLNFVEVLPAN